MTSKFYKSKIRACFDGALVVDACHRRGGITLCWKRPLYVDIKSYSSNYIRAIVSELNCNMNWDLIGFYESQLPVIDGDRGYLLII